MRSGAMPALRQRQTSAASPGSEVLTHSPKRVAMWQPTAMTGTTAVANPAWQMAVTGARPRAELAARARWFRAQRLLGPEQARNVAQKDPGQGKSSGVPSDPARTMRTERPVAARNWRAHSVNPRESRRQRNRTSCMAAAKPECIVGPGECRIKAEMRQNAQLLRRAAETASKVGV